LSTEKTILLMYLEILLDLNLKIILDHQNNYVRFKLVTRTSINSLQHSIMHSSCSNVLYNYFDGPTKLFSDLNLIKFLDTQQQNHSFHEKK